MKTNLLLACTLTLTACVQSGPDKTVGGTLLGGGWGAGAGAIVGHQLGQSGEGALIGAGVGAVDGLLTGGMLDVGEAKMLQQQRELKSLKAQNDANSSELMRLQAKFDRAAYTSPVSGVYQVFFDTDETSLKAGSISNLQVIGDSLRDSPSAYLVNVVGHSDDSGNPEYNLKVSEARARTTAAYLAARGISMDHIKISSSGSTLPIASNNTEAGRQLNRRVDIYITK